LAGFFVLCIIVWTKLSPDIAGLGQSVSWGEKFHSSIKIIPVILLAIFLLAIIYLGVATPAEAAALGCLFSLLLCIVYGKLQWKMLLEGVRRTIATSGFLLLLMGTAKVLGFMMSKAGIMYGLQDILSALPIWLFILVLYFTIALMGLFLEGTSIIVLTTPIFAPAVSAIGLDLVWYGVMLVLFIEIALLTPPVGMNCYIVAEVGKSFGIGLEDVFRGIVPFLVALASAVVLVTLLPDLALWLPSTMR
jgi:C4-dicarboxylate transporter, DctM subunit